MASHHSTLTFPSVEVDTLGLLIDLMDSHARKRKYDTIYQFFLTEVETLAVIKLYYLRDVTDSTGVKTKVTS